MIYVFLADGFEEIEALTPVDILRRSGFMVKTVGVTGAEILGAHDICVKADISLAEVDINEAELLFLPGGMPGTTNLQASAELEKLILEANERNIYIAAICAAPMILGELKLLCGKEATCFPGFEEHLIGSRLSGEAVVVAKNIITSRGAGTASTLAFKMVEILKGKEAADELYKTMQY